MGEGGRSYFNIAILVPIVIMMWISTNQGCAADAVERISRNECGGSSKEYCQLLSDEVEMEFLMDSEANKRVFEASASVYTDSIYVSLRALDAGQATCGRKNGKPCLPNANNGGKKPPICVPPAYNRNCH